MVAALWAVGALGVWERRGRLVAWFRERPDDLAIEGRWSLEPDRDWQAEWKATLEPVRAGRFTVVPTWLADDRTDDPSVIVLDPGRAFGSGHHATTAMCLEMLDDLDLAGARVADVGCGSGLLGIAAARRGAQVTAVDVDPQAVTTTRENAERNGVIVDVRHGSVEVLPAPAEVVVANLVSDLIVSLAGELVGASTGVLILSGIARERGESVGSALQRAGATVARQREREGWLALRADVGDRRGTSPRPPGTAVGALTPLDRG